MNKFLGQMTRPMWIAAAAGAVLGLILGLIIGWGIWPVQYYDASAKDLRADLQRQWLAMTIQSFNRDRNPAAAQSRWTELGDAGQDTLDELRVSPQTYGLREQDIAAFAAAVNAVPAQPGAAGEKPSTGSTAPANLLNTLLPIFCVLVLLIGGLLVYLFVFRNRQPALARAVPNKGGGGQVLSSSAQVVQAPVGGYVVGPDQEQPIAQYLTTYAAGNDLYDDSFSVDSASGEFLGECGVGISETIGVGDPKKVTAFEVWLFDKNDIQTVTKVLMSEHAYNDPGISQRLASKGEPVLAEPGKTIVLETATLQLEATIENMGYGQGALPQKSFFDQMTLRIQIWQKRK